MNTIGERIKYIRNDILKMSQVEFGEKIGIKQQSLHLIESNITKMPRMARLEKIIELSGVNRAWLLANEGFPLPAAERVAKAEDSYNQLEKEIEDLKQDIRNIRAVVTAILEK